MNKDIDNIQKLYEANQKQPITVNSWNGAPKGYTGPAIIHPDGTQVWYKNGIWHREDGPAVIYPDGTQFWYRYGECHREDGPAVIYADGSREWYLDDKKYSREDYYRELHKRGKISDEELFAELL